MIGLNRSIEGDARSSIKLYLLANPTNLHNFHLYSFSQLLIPINFTKGRREKASPTSSFPLFSNPHPYNFNANFYPPPRILIKILFYARLNVNDALKRAEIQAGIISYEDRRIISAFRS